MMNYWKRRFYMLVDVLKESNPPGAVIGYLAEVSKRMDLDEENCLERNRKNG